MARIKKCCCCIPLDVGANILGVLNLLSCLAGLSTLISYFCTDLERRLVFEPAISVLLLCGFPPFVSWVAARRQPSNYNKRRYAASFVMSWTFGTILGFFAIFSVTVAFAADQGTFCRKQLGSNEVNCNSVGSLIGFAALGSVGAIGLFYYYYLCLSAYAEKDRFYSAVNCKARIWDPPEDE